MSGLGEGVEPDGVKKLDNICQGDCSDHERVIIAVTFKLHVCNSATGWSDSGQGKQFVTLQRGDTQHYTTLCL